VLRLVTQHGVVAKGVADEVGELGQRLYACVACADEEERQLAAPVLLRGRRICGFEPSQDMVAEVDRIGEGLEAERVIGETGNRQRARDRAERDDDVLEAHGHHVVLGLDTRAALLRVEGGRAAEDQLTTTWRGSSVPDAASGSIGV
jgi:hypothetical protein